MAALNQTGNVLIRLTRRAGMAMADLVMPPVCIACHLPLATHNTICALCWSKIDFIGPPLCDRLGIPLPYDTGGVMVSAASVTDPPAFDRARAAAHYTGVMRDLVHDFKFRDRQDARQLFGRWLAKAGHDLLQDAEVLVPVPLSRWRLFGRRFNQSAILARELARTCRLPFKPLALERVRRTKSQVGLTREQRRQNVRGAFRVPANQRQEIEQKRVVLIDDVITTGATASAAAVALRNAGATRIDVLALALVTGNVLLAD